MLDFTKSELVVTSQAELNSVPIDYHGRILIEFGTASNCAVVSRKYNYASVEAWGKASVVASGNASVFAWGNASVFAWGNASVVASGNASVFAGGKASVEAWGNASVEASGNASVFASGNASVFASGNASVFARGNASVEAWGKASVEARGFSHAAQFGSSKVVTHDFARVIQPTKDIETFMAFHSIEDTDGKSVWYKAVRKQDYGVYVSARDDTFFYEIGAVATDSQTLDTDRREGGGYGLYISTLKYALDYGKDWKDLAILEVEVDTAEIEIPYNSAGNVRVHSLKVLREVPLEECGLFGKMLLKRRGQRSE